MPVKWTYTRKDSFAHGEGHKQLDGEYKGIKMRLSKSNSGHCAGEWVVFVFSDAIPMSQWKSAAAGPHLALAKSAAIDDARELLGEPTHFLVYTWSRQPDGHWTARDRKTGVTYEVLKIRKTWLVRVNGKEPAPKAYDTKIEAQHAAESTVVE
jgi:hypothetical protein